MKKKHRKGQSRHHLRNKARKGRGGFRNICWLEIEKHESFHILFGNRDLSETIALLIRLKRAKENQRGWVI